MNSSPGNTRSKVIFVNRYFLPDQSATSQLLSDLSLGLVKRGLQVHVICSRQLYDQAGAKLEPRASIGGVPVHRVWTTRFGRRELIGRAVDYATFYLSSGWMLLRLLSRGDIVVAKTDPPLISIVAMMAAKLKGAHLVNWLQDIFPEVATQLGANRLPGWLDAGLRGLRDASLRAALVNVVLGERMQEFLATRGIPATKIAIIENWADEGGGAPRLGSASDLRSQLGLAEKFVVGYSGNLGRAHEFQTLLDAASLLSTHPEIIFLMIGAGVGMAMLEEAVASRALHNFRFLAYQPRDSLADSLAASDVHLVSLRPQLEGLVVPSKFYGILAAGRPVIFIGDPDGELARIIGGAGIGATVEIGDASGLAQRLVELSLDPPGRGTIGASAYGFYRAHYTVQRALDRWTEILEPPSNEIPLRQADPAHDASSRIPSSR
ncbi:MAG: glycosyltransferase family 4 protein [Steroidobacteraceae bacterium]